MKIGDCKRWYDYSKEDVHKGVAAEVHRIREQQAEQRRDLAHFMSLYAAGNVSGLGRTAEPDKWTWSDYLHTGAGERASTCRRPSSTPRSR